MGPKLCAHGPSDCDSQTVLCLSDRRQDGSRGATQAPWLPFTLPSRQKPCSPLWELGHPSPSPSSHPPLHPHPQSQRCCTPMPRATGVPPAHPPTTPDTGASHRERQREQGMAVSIATLGFSIPAPKMPNQGWRGAVPCCRRGFSLPLPPSLSPPCQVSSRQGESGRGSGTLGPTKATDQLVCNLV